MTTKTRWFRLAAVAAAFSLLTLAGCGDDETEPTPGLPYITSNSRDADQLADAVGSAIEDLSQSDRQKLRLKGLVQLTAAQYLQIANPAE